jgi:general secretion pathway protein D
MTMATSCCLLRGVRGALIAFLGASLALPPPLWAQAAARAARTQPAGHSPALKSRAPVTVNFVNADIEAVTRAFAAMIERQIAVDPRVKGNITVYSEQPLTIREAYLNYLSALRGLGFAMVENGGLLKVVPEADAKLQAGTVSVGPVELRGDQVLTQIFTLRHENPNNMVPILRPLISANNTINVNPGNSSLVITDYADNLQRLAKIIAALDQPAQTDFEIVPLKHAVAADIAQLVQRLADGGGGGPTAPGAPPTGGATTVIADGRSNSLIVRAPNAARLATVLSTIYKLDRAVEGSGANGNIWVVHLKNADATKLATVLRASFGAGSGGGGAGAAGGGVAIGGTTPGQPPTSSGTSSQSSSPIVASAGPSTGGFVQSDPSTNSLIITAAEPFYRQIRSMIDQLDSRRAQVYIESMIVEVSGENAADFGFQWQGLVGNTGDRVGLIGGTNFTPSGGAGNIISLATGAASGTVALGEGINIGLIRNYGGTYVLSAIARALQSQTNTNIVSTPNLITLDNEEAKIVVGSNVPFVTGQFSNTGAGGGGGAVNPFQTIERKDVGITLRIKPQIGEGGTVRMTIFQEVSTVSDKVAPGTTNAGPSTNKRLIESNVVVDDGGIIVLGGLIEDRFVENRSQVPLLGDIPYLGALFRSQNRTKNRTNLMVFLRPVVLRDAGTSDRISLDRYDVIRAQQQEAQPARSIVMPINEAPVLPLLREGQAIPTLPPAPIRGLLREPATPASGAASGPAN